MLKHTRPIRKIMEQHGRQQIFTNKYKTMRSVKCYAPKDQIAQTDLINDLTKYLNDNNIPVDINVTAMQPGFWGSWPAVIVRLPLE